MSRIRIIGGAWRRRMLDVTDLPGLRPTGDAVRETLFNWLGQDMGGQTCLDVFAGTGALGLEAASRGAARVTLLETHPKAVAQLQRNFATLRNIPVDGAVEIVRADALKWLALPPRRYDVVFLDPPFHSGWFERLAGLVEAALEPQGLVYAEAEFPVHNLGNLRSVKQGRAGHVYYQLLSRELP
ncbi:MAG: 16S rRNA (guanine(966)-N(2))-methyltransferase RsmD [Rhodocyclaceae bacterium]|nr:16S rRNA (guanine(966)-N(2))-methyltransferase RsmD [Rhodocyclaceae bacterium]MBX3667384.1 16S rRNA (guanine(966)-N(2))-methyltransferase RsmD [Rhodocyclaceae bacterium]